MILTSNTPVWPEKGKVLLEAENVPFGNRLSGAGTFCDALLKKPSIVNSLLGAVGAGLTVNNQGISTLSLLVISGPGDVFDPNGAAVDTMVTVVAGGVVGGVSPDVNA